MSLTCFLFANLTDKKLDILPRPNADGPNEAALFPGVMEVIDDDETSPAPGTPKFTPQDEASSNNILAYVSVLAAVVLGLLIYVAYKWWVLWSDCKIRASFDG